jgi:hypothetical protein
MTTQATTVTLVMAFRVEYTLLKKKVYSIIQSILTRNVMTMGFTKSNSWSIQLYDGFIEIDISFIFVFAELNYLHFAGSYWTAK